MKLDLTRSDVALAVLEGPGVEERLMDALDRFVARALRARRGS
jgi:hypothetical protein